MKTGLVLGGGSARGAYEAGVISYLRDELPRELGRHVPLPVLAGTSVGALNACFVAATADAPESQGQRLVATWQNIRIEQIVQTSLGDVLHVAREFLGTAPQKWQSGLQGGLVNPAGLIDVVGRVIPWRGLQRNVKAGIVEAIATSATHLATGRVVIFVQRRDGGVPPWSRDPHVAARAARLGPKYALASAALPLVFPAVRIGGELYIDGGLRNSLPLSPALRLGAERVIIVPLRHQPLPGTAKFPEAPASAPTVASAPYLLGKATNALLLDATDADLDRLDRLNAIIDAGCRAYGPQFVETINGALVPMRNQPVRRVRRIVVRPSQDIGKLAAHYVHSEEFKKRVKGRLIGRVIRKLADREAEEEADLVSYLLFDGGFADQLIQLGRADARAQKAEWLRFFDDAPQPGEVPPNELLSPAR